MTPTRIVAMHVDSNGLERSLAEVRRAPATEGTPEMLVVRRPDVGERIVLSEAVLDPVYGVVGDSWRDR